MKKGLIFYITEGRENLREWPDLNEQKRRWGADEVSFATSESEIAHCWWQMLARGMHIVSCIRASFDLETNSVEPKGEPLRLCG